VTLQTRDADRMKIYVNRIPAQGLHDETSYDPVALDLDRFDVHPKAPVHVTSFITKAADELIVQAQIRCQLEVNCARCLTTFEIPLGRQAIFTYHVAPNEVVDISEDLRQEVILAYPMIPLCQEACKGLCRQCGQNWNLAGCAHLPPA